MAQEESLEWDGWRLYNIFDWPWHSTKKTGKIIVKLILPTSSIEIRDFFSLKLLLLLAIIELISIRKSIDSCS